MSHKVLTKKIHENGLLMEDIILLGASIFAGGVCSQVFSSLCDMYPISQIVGALDDLPEHEADEMDANDLAEWISDHCFDGYLCLIQIPTEVQGEWTDHFFYGDSIEACVDQAIGEKALEAPF